MKQQNKQWYVLDGVTWERIDPKTIRNTITGKKRKWTGFPWEPIGRAPSEKQIERECHTLANDVPHPGVNIPLRWWRESAIREIYIKRHAKLEHYEYGNN